MYMLELVVSPVFVSVETKQTNQNDVSVGGSKNYGGLQSFGNLV
jgi:hypothetical protein